MKAFPVPLACLLLVLSLAACQAPAVRTAPPTPEILRVQYSPALRGWVTALNGCANHLPLIGLEVKEIPADQLDLAVADLALRFGPAQKQPTYAAQLGMDEVVLVANPANLLSNLTPAEVTAIYTRKTTQWSDLVNGQSQLIQAWSYLPGDDLRQVFDLAFLGGDHLTPHAYLAPDTTAMLEAVSKEPAAIGFMLKSQVDQTVKIIRLDGQPAADLNQPILALANNEPQGNLRQLILCMQN